MNRDEIMQLDISGIETRMGEIRELVQDENADVTGLEAELDALEERRNVLRQQAERRREIARRVAAGEAGGEGRALGVDVSAKGETRYNAGSPEYRTAWLKHMAQVQGGGSLLGEMTAEERAAFTFTTANTGSVVPTQTMDKIIELVNSDAPMLEDAQPSGMTSGFAVPRHKRIDAGDAKGVAEGEANDDEQDTFDLLPLSGIEIKKHVVLSRKMQFQSIEAFETWLTTHLAQRIRVAKEKVILARLGNTAPDGGTKVDNAGVDAANTLTAQTYDDATIRKLFSLIDAQGEKVVYANNATIWNKLAGIEDAQGQKLFVPSAMVDPVVQGRIYGASVKADSNLADDEVYLGVRAQVLANDFDELTVFTAIEPKTANTIITAYALFDAGLQNPKGFVKATFTGDPVKVSLAAAGSTTKKVAAAKTPAVTQTPETPAADA